MRIGGLVATAAFLTLCSGGSAAVQPATETTVQVRHGFDMEVRHPPAPVLTGERPQLVYELHLTNFASAPLALQAIQVLGPDDVILQDLRGERLIASVGAPGSTSAELDRLSVSSGRRAVLYLAVPLTTSAVPANLRHRMIYETGQPQERVTVVGGETRPDLRPPVTLGPPLRGGPWTAVYEPAMERGHRRVLYAVGGRVRIPGRHAIDWIASGPAQNANHTDPSDGGGAEVLAVADASVASTRDGVPEPRSGADRPLVRLQDATGNFIALSLGEGRYAFYEHLRPGLLVRPGDRVRRGQVIGRLGSTGQASGPHLHFHVSDADSPLAAEGLPYRLEGYRVVGAFSSIQAATSGGPWRRRELVTAAPPSMPAPNVVVHFDR